jgi:hypothetical protein
MEEHVKQLERGRESEAAAVEEEKAAPEASLTPLSLPAPSSEALQITSGFQVLIL